MDKDRVAGSLNDSPWRRSDKDFGETLRQAIGIGFLLPMLSCGAFVIESFGPGLKGHVLWLHIGCQISQVLCLSVPDSGKVRLAVGKTRCGRSEIRFAVGSSR